MPPFYLIANCLSMHQGGNSQKWRISPEGIDCPCRFWYNGGMNTNPTKASKSILSRLLASENMIVMHDVNARTASFDIDKRILKLPVLKDMSNEQYDMFIGHEVSHALYTPFTDEDKQSLKNNKCLSSVHKIAGGDSSLYSLAHSYMNIIEDARIERLIKDKFPGIRRDFYIGYSELHAKDFFGIDGVDVNTLSFIDRINLHFKIGAHIHVEFSDEEMEYVKMIENTKSFDDVIDVAAKVWQYVKDKKMSETSNSNVDILSEHGDDESGENKVDAGSSDKKKKNMKSDWSSRSIPPDQCITQQAFDSNFNSLIDTNENNSHHYYNLPTFNMKTGIVGYKELVEMFNHYCSLDPLYYSNMATTSDKFIADSNRIVNILAQAFAAKKAAKEHQRTMTNRTGVIDTVRMMDYKFNDDIFRRINITHKGKSHGLVFFMDLSGSMSPILEDTFKQLIQLVLFCKRVNIPFEVYGFTTKMRDGTEHDRYDLTEENFKELKSNCWDFDSRHGETENPLNPFTLVNIFSSKMTKNEINEMIRNVFVTCAHYKRGGGTYYIPPIMELSSTPLIESIIAAMDIIPMFKNANKLDIVNTVFLTDGEATGVNIEHPNSHVTKGFITYDTDAKYGIESNAIQMFKNYTGSKAICFFLCDTKSSLNYYAYCGYSVGYDGADLDFSNAESMYIKEGWCCAHKSATLYDEKFIIRAESTVEEDNLEEILSTRTSNVGIRNAFVKALNATMVSRVMLNRFIDLIATD
jgi:hypothetical protein